MNRGIHLLGGVRLVLKNFERCGEFVATRPGKSGFKSLCKKVGAVRVTVPKIVTNIAHSARKDAVAATKIHKTPILVENASMMGFVAAEFALGRETPSRSQKVIGWP